MTPVDPMPFEFWALDAVCDVSSDYSGLNSAVDLTLNLNCKVLSPLPPAQRAAPVNQGGHRCTYRRRWCGARLSCPELSLLLRLSLRGDFRYDRQKERQCFKRLETQFPH